MIKIKQNKTGQFTASFYDILAILILIILMVFWMMVLRPPIKDESYEIENKIQFLDDDDNLITMLRTPVNDYTLLDVIRENKFNKNDLELIELINEIIEPVFGPACWELFVDDESHTKVKCKTILNEELMFFLRLFEC